MEAEELLKRLKVFVDEMEDYDGEPIIIPTVGDPTVKQNNVSFVIMEKFEGGRIPRFTINVKDRLYEL